MPAGVPLAAGVLSATQPPPPSQASTEACRPASVLDAAHMGGTTGLPSRPRGALQDCRALQLLVMHPVRVRTRIQQLRVVES